MSRPQGGDVQASRRGSCPGLKAGRTGIYLGPRGASHLTNFPLDKLVAQESPQPIQLKLVHAVHLFCLFYTLLVLDEGVANATILLRTCAGGLPPIKRFKRCVYIDIRPSEMGILALCCGLYSSAFEHSPPCQSPLLQQVRTRFHVATRRV